MCRFDNELNACTEIHRLLVWVRYLADVIEPKTEWIALPFDPSKAPHKYDLVFDGDLADDITFPGNGNASHTFKFEQKSREYLECTFESIGEAY